MKTIKFINDLIPAILEGRKTQTRRVFKGQEPKYLPKDLVIVENDNNIPITIKIKDVHLERCHDISWEDCLKEGLETEFSGIEGIQDLEKKWEKLWDSIYGGFNEDLIHFAYKFNPKVWVIEFELVQENQN